MMISKIISNINDERNNFMCNIKTIELMHPFTNDLSINGYIKTNLPLDEFDCLLSSLLVDIHFKFLTDEQGNVFSEEFWENNLEIVLCTCFSNYVYRIDSNSREYFININKKNQISLDFLMKYNPRYMYDIDTSQRVCIKDNIHDFKYYRFYTTFDELDIAYANDEEYINYKDYIDSNFDETSLANLIKSLQSSQSPILTISNISNFRNKKYKILHYKKLLPY